MYPLPTEPQFQVRLTKHTGVLLIWFNQRRTYTGSYSELLRIYERVQQHNYVAGWWSITSLLVWNLVAILGNRWAMKELRGRVLMARMPDQDSVDLQTGHGLGIQRPAGRHTSAG